MSSENVLTAQCARKIGKALKKEFGLREMLALRLLFGLLLMSAGCGALFRRSNVLIGWRVNISVLVSNITGDS